VNQSEDRDEISSHFQRMVERSEIDNIANRLRELIAHLESGDERRSSEDAEFLLVHLDQFLKPIFHPSGTPQAAETSIDRLQACVWRTLLRIQREDLQGALSIAREGLTAWARHRAA
jgi:hypothetical protein